MDANKDTTSSDSLKNRLRSRNKKQIIVDTLDLTDEVTLPVKPSPVIIDNLILSDDEMTEPGIESSDKSSTKQSYDQSEDLVNPEITIMVHWRCLEWKKFTIRKYQTITPIFQHFAKAEGVSEDRICFEWEGKYPRITDTPDSLGIEYLAMFDGGTAAPTGSNTRTASPARSKLDANTLELKVQRKGVKRPMMVRMKKTDQMIVLMVQCAEQLNLPLDKLKFSFDGEDINKSDTPADLELEGGECVDLFVSS
uniref:Ubiquitin-like domain-containing protein n=1 Tax=Timema tahoe TaxID=61484 RepID=A0A7R9FK62_9NEOP|nr:unnamed protein product [Timema tahoe]